MTSANMHEANWQGSRFHGAGILWSVRVLLFRNVTFDGGKLILLEVGNPSQCTAWGNEALSTLRVCY